MALARPPIKLTVKLLFLAQVIVNLNKLEIQVRNTSYYEVARDPYCKLKQAWSQAPETQSPDTDKLVLDFYGFGASYNDFSWECLSRFG